MSPEEILKQINPPKIENDFCLYANSENEPECQYLNFNTETCTLFNKKLENIDGWNKYKRCPQCKELTKLLEELK